MQKQPLNIYDPRKGGGRLKTALQTIKLVNP